MLSYEHKLKQREDIINDLERYASYFRGKNYFDGNDGAQNLLVFQVGEKYFTNNFGQFTHPQGGMARNIIIFRVNSSNSVHATKKNLILGHGLTQRVNNTTVYAEKTYSSNFSAENKIFCLSLHYNGDNSYLFVNGKEFTKFKPKKSEIKANQLTLGSISTIANLSSSHTEDSKLYGNVYDLSVDYSAISNDKIHDIHAYLMRKMV